MIENGFSILVLAKSIGKSIVLGMHKLMPIDLSWVING